MIDVLSILTQEPQETWCDKFYHNGAYKVTGAPLWGIGSSVWHGIVAHVAVPMKSSQPFDGLWRWHYNALLDEMEMLGLNKYDIDSQEDMKRRIAVLCQRNHYPANSMAHIYVWREGSPISGTADYAIFQKRLSANAFDDGGTKRIILEGGTGETINLRAGHWADRSVEAEAERKVKERSKDDLIDYAGMALYRPDGKIARTTLGNIYVTHRRNVTCVKDGEGAKPCALTPFLRTAIEEINEQNDPRLAITLSEADGIDDTMLTTASGCFVLDSEVGLAPIMRLRTTFGNELTRQLAAKFRQLF